MMSKNKFEVHGDMISISHPDWDFIASATIREDYIDEIQSVTWSKNGDYLYSSKLKKYLHIYIVRKWYGDECYEKMSSENYVVDHMDNNGYNCCINNLSFLTSDENKAKGMTVDKLSKEKAYLALSLYKDFSTQLYQMTLFFNYPAVAKISNLTSPAVIELAYFLYDREYEIVLNDARNVLYDYRRDYSFEPEKLHDIDFHIEGCYGYHCSKETYDAYINGGHGHGVCMIIKKAPIQNWKVDDQVQFFHLRGKPIDVCE